MKQGEKGVILMITIAFVLILIAIAGVSIILMTNHAHLTEGSVGRTRAFYTAEAARIKALQELRLNNGTFASNALNSTLTLNNLTAEVTIESPGFGTGPGGTRNLTIKVNY